MGEIQLEFIVNKNNDFEVQDPEWGLPPRAEHWPTVEALRAVAALEEDPRETIRKLRLAVPFAGPKTMFRRIR